MTAPTALTRCPKCHVRLRIPQSTLDTTIRCPACSENFLATSSSSATHSQSQMVIHPSVEPVTGPPRGTVRFAAVSGQPIGLLLFAIGVLLGVGTFGSNPLSDPVLNGILSGVVTLMFTACAGAWWSLGVLARTVENL